jgi:hypothetical protein
MASNCKGDKGSSWTVVPAEEEEEEETFSKHSVVASKD